MILAVLITSDILNGLIKIKVNQVWTDAPVCNESYLLWLFVGES